MGIYVQIWPFMWEIESNIVNFGSQFWPLNHANTPLHPIFTWLRMLLGVQKRCDIWKRVNSSRDMPSAEMCFWVGFTCTRYIINICDFGTEFWPLYLADMPQQYIYILFHPLLGARKRRCFIQGVNLSRAMALAKVQILGVHRCMVN